MLVTAAVAAGKGNIDNGYEVAEISKLVEHDPTHYLRVHRILSVKSPKAKCDALFKNVILFMDDY